MSIVNLKIDSTARAWASGLAASLPVSVKRDGEPANLVLLEGTADWPQRLTRWIEDGHRRFLLIDPAIPSVQALDAAIAAVASSAADVTISETHGGNPALKQFRDALGGPYSAVTITGTGTIALADLVLQQLRLARSAGLGKLDLVHALVSRDSVVAMLDAVHGDAPLLLRLTATRSASVLPHHRFMAHSHVESACIEVAGETDARPASAFRANQEGGRVLPTIYESAHRAALRAIASGETASAIAFSDWKEDAMLATAIASAG